MSQSRPLTAATRKAALDGLEAALRGDSAEFFAAVAAIEDAAELRELAYSAKALSELAATLARLRAARS